MKTSTLFLALALIGFSQQGFAAQLASELTCDEAITAYAKDKKIDVIANGKDRVPLFGLSPVGEAADCSLGGTSGYSVKTTDNDNCIIGNSCTDGF